MDPDSGEAQVIEINPSLTTPAPPTMSDEVSPLGGENSATGLLGAVLHLPVAERPVLFRHFD